MTTARSHDSGGTGASGRAADAPVGAPGGVGASEATATTARRRLVADDRGAALLEFAFVMPLLMAILMGMVTSGMAFSQHLQLTHATREGARFAASIPVTQSFTSGTWAENVRDLVVERAVGDLDVDGADVCVALVQGSSDSASQPLHVVSTPYRSASEFSTHGRPCMDGAVYPVTVDDPGRRVQVSATRPATIETVFRSWAVTLGSEATAKSEGDG